MLVPYFFDQNFHSVIMRALSPSICIACNIKIKTLWLMVAEQQRISKAVPIFKVTELQYYTFYAKTKF